MVKYYCQFVVDQFPVSALISTCVPEQHLGVILRETPIPQNAVSFMARVPLLLSNLSKDFWIKERIEFY